MKTSEFDYYLPKKFIAQKPVSPRDSSKLLVYLTKEDEIIHTKFRDIEKFLRNGDLLVLNKSKVIPARIIFKDAEKQLEIFLLKKIAKKIYQAMVKPGKYFKIGKRFFIGKNIYGNVLKILNDGSRIIYFNKEIKKYGQVPTPPYIRNKNIKLSQYQTVYAQNEGSIAAPTAGFHFTKKLLKDLKLKGIQIEKVLLHIGRGTFLPVKTENINEHVMHSEYFELTNQTAEQLNKAKNAKRRIIAVGTTSVRVLEHCFNSQKGFIPQTGETNIFIYPDYKWKVVDILITNFHLPKSTLIMLVASFLENKGIKNPIKKILDLYELAKKKEYRFYSFGDAMLII